MFRLALLALALACAACATPSANGRTDWSCDGGKAFSTRSDPAGGVELFAAGRVYTLPSGVNDGAGARYDNGEVLFVDRGRSAELHGAYASPYENCRRN